MSTADRNRSCIQMVVGRHLGVQALLLTRGAAGKGRVFQGWGWIIVALLVMLAIAARWADATAMAAILPARTISIAAGLSVAALALLEAVPGGQAARIAAMAVSALWWPRAGAPVLAVWGGEEDRSGPRESRDRLEDLVAGPFEAEIYPGADHMVLIWPNGEGVPPPAFADGFMDRVGGWIERQTG